KNKRAVTVAYYPQNSPYKPGQIVTWDDTTNGGCPVYGDPDMPSPKASYVGKPKLFYTMDSMDIGPIVDANGLKVKDAQGNQLYELHYTPDWTHKLGSACERVNPLTNKININQLKYRTPPTERTVITYSTHHAATAGSPNILVLLASGTARKIN